MTDTILFVDDETNILQAFKRQFKSQFSIQTATNGPEALEILTKADEPMALVVSDFRMPGMDGIQLLARIKELSPNTVGILLTGNADMNMAIDAVNKGCLFRFLTKPCSNEVLLNTIFQALQQYHLVTAEQELQEKIMTSSVQLLIEILSLANPAAFSRSMRVRKIAVEITRRMKLANAWQFILAATLSQVGCVALPKNLLEKVEAGQPLTPTEESLFASHPMIGSRLLTGIPRVDPVAEMIKDQYKPYEAFTLTSTGPTEEQFGAQILKVALDYDQLVRHYGSHAEAVAQMQVKTRQYNPAVMEALAKQEVVQNDLDMRLIHVEDLETGMILNQDLLSRGGDLLVAKGVTVGITHYDQIQRAAQESGVVEPFKVLTHRKNPVGQALQAPTR